MNETKQKIIDAVIEELKSDLSKGDETILNELLGLIPIEVLVKSLPEEKWGQFNTREVSIEWWNDLTWKSQIELVGKHISESRLPGTLTGREIQKIWEIINK